MLVKDYYQDCLLHDDSILAHFVYHLLAEKKISIDDDESKIDFSQADQQKVAELIETNFLCIHKVGIYSLKMAQKSFAFIYARSEEEAIQFYTQTFHKPPLNCHEYPLEYVVTKGNGFISFRDMKKQFESFPAVAGFFKKE